MSDPMVEEGAAAPAAQTAGALLREARQARGMHIAALAAAIKVTPRKLEALEGDRYDELVDATFTRALAQAVCRALKIDAEPVLARLPATPGKGLQVSTGLNAPLRRSAVRRDSGDRPVLSRPVVWGSAVLVLAALAVYFLPAGWLSSLHLGGGGAEPAASAVAPVASAPANPAAMPVSEAPAAAPAMAAASSAAAPSAAASAIAAAPASAQAVATSPSAAPSAPVAPAGSDLVVRTTTGPSWVEVEDGHGKLLISRTVEAGESVFIAGPTPLRVKIGNVAVTQLSFRGQPVALASTGRDRNVAHLELK